MSVLGNGLHDADHCEEALSVREVELSTLRRLGDSEHNILVVLNNLARTYEVLGRDEQALDLRRDVYSGALKLHGEEDARTLQAAMGYAASLVQLERFEEAMALYRKTLPVARRVLGESSELTLGVRTNYAMAFCADPAATLDGLREAVTTLEESERIVRRVFGGDHPLTSSIEGGLRQARALLCAREIQSSR